MISAPQYPPDFQFTAKANSLFELDFAPPVSKRARWSSQLVEFRRLLGLLSEDCPQLLENCRKEKPAIQYRQHINQTIESLVSGGEVPTLATSIFDSDLDELEKRSYPFCSSSQSPRLLLLDQIIWIDRNNRGPSSFSPCQYPSLHHLCSLIIEPLLSSADWQLSTTLRTLPEKRGQVIGMVIKSVINPSASSSLVRADIFNASVLSSSMFSSQQQVPADVMVSVIKPILTDFCHDRISLPLVEGLSRIADIFPFLFNQQMVCKKLVELLQHFVDEKRDLNSHADKSSMFVKLASTVTLVARNVDCSDYVAPLCDAAMKFFESMAEFEKNDLLETIVQFLSLYPTHAMSYLHSTSDQAGRMKTLLKQYAPHSSLWEGDSSKPSEVMKMSLFYLNPDLCDVTVVCEESKSGVVTRSFPANKVILRLRCSFFEKMLACGMSESSQDSIHLGDVDIQAFDIAFQHIHGVDGLPVDNVDLLMRVVRMADYLGLDELHRFCELRLCSLVDSSTVMQIASESFVVNSSCWGQISALHLSPLASKCREVVLQCLCNRSQVNFHDPNILDLLSFWFR